MAIGTVVERAETYAETVLEDCITPSQELLQRLVVPGSQDFAFNARKAPPGTRFPSADECAMAMIADMEWFKAQLAMAYRIGHQVGVESMERTGRPKR